jgi:hypothetical protein
VTNEKFYVNLWIFDSGADQFFNSVGHHFAKKH